VGKLTGHENKRKADREGLKKATQRKGSQPPRLAVGLPCAKESRPSEQEPDFDRRLNRLPGEGDSRNEGKSTSPRRKEVSAFIDKKAPRSRIVVDSTIN